MSETHAADAAPHIAATSMTAETPAIVRSGESQWALVWREYRKRKLAVAALIVVVLLITLSVFAPFLANDRPFYYRGYNRFEYRESQRTLMAMLQSLADAKPKPAAKPDAKAESAEPKPGDKSKTDKPAPKKGEPASVVIERQFELMASLLVDAAALRELQTKTLDAVRRAEAANAGATDGSATSGGATKPLDPKLAAEIRTLRNELRKSFDGAGVKFAVQTHWPVFASLHWSDAVLILFNVALVFLPFWLPLSRRVIPGEKPGTRTAFAFLLLAGLPLLAGLAWKLGVPARLDRAKYKQGVAADAPAADVAKAPVVYEKVVWPPVPYGLDEDDLGRKYLRPDLARFVPAWALAIPAEPPVNDDQKQTRGPYDGPNWLGTDGTGRDILCRMLWGGRISLSVGIVATAIELVLGIVLGAVAGYFRGWVDLVVSRVIEVVICFPSFFLILTIIAFLGPSIYNIMLVIGLTGWTGLARLVRGDFLRLADQEFVLAARALGYSPMRIIFGHVLPNAMAPVLVTATFAIAGAILTESGLSFLGLGITAPKPSWGGILSTGRDSIFRAPWIIYFPGLALFVTITAYNLVGEAFRDASDPRLRGRMG